jgi:hypothetical protein
MYYKVFDLEDEENIYVMDFQGIKNFLGGIWEDEDDELFDHIHSDSVTIEGLQEIAIGCGYFIEED